MSDSSSLVEEDLDRYTIGFTENTYQAGLEPEICSPTPHDPSRGFTSPSMNHAGRHNRGAERHFLDRSTLIERKRSQSVTKINSSMLDLVFELTERRKSCTPQQSPRNINSSSQPTSPRTYNTPSPTSLASPLGKTLTHAPTNGVNQCLNRINSQIRSFDNSFSIRHPTQLSPLLQNMNLEKETGKKLSSTWSGSQFAPSKSVPPNTQTRFKDANRSKGVQGTRLSSDDDSKGLSSTWSGGHFVDHKRQNVSNDSSSSERLKFSDVVDLITDRKRSKGFDSDDDWDENKVSFKSVVNRLISQGRRKSMPEQKLLNRPKMKLFYCQCSYKERSEKGRMDNIRRRHASQANTGPLDFNKLRRQVTGSRCNTVV